MTDNLLYEIGLECEYWLLDKEDNIIEAPKYNFPADEMGFLIELRSIWGSDPDTVVNSLEGEIFSVRKKAEQLGFKIHEAAWLPVTKEWQEYIANKYQHRGLPDHTRNIYSEKQQTQHTGFREGRATAGLHVHFSIWDIEKEHFIWLSDSSIVRIVFEMDNVFLPEINRANRIIGEWERKGIGDDSGRPHGFEYRSLPATVDKLKAAKKAIKILLSIEKED